MIEFKRIQFHRIAFGTTTDNGPGSRIGGGQFKEIPFFCTPVDITTGVGKIRSLKCKFGCLIISGCQCQIKLYQILRNTGIINVEVAVSTSGIDVAVIVIDVLVACFFDQGETCLIVGRGPYIRSLSYKFVILAVESHVVVFVDNDRRHFIRFFKGGDSLVQSYNSGLQFGHTCTCSLVVHSLGGSNGSSKLIGGYQSRIVLSIRLVQNSLQLNRRIMILINSLSYFD
ncbi:MAG: hypothetical protein BWY95_01511 [Bacteroidetes bacterium ADurb.BinA104]|nr:MAG: hypothetical protein BWY95_01511 [Bacteroidetes bacterium ADurb.BinA104]